MVSTVGGRWNRNQWFDIGPAVIALLALFSLAVLLLAFLSRYESTLFSRSRSDVDSMLAPHCDALNLAISNRLSLLHGLSAYVEAVGFEEGDAMVKGFPKFAKVLCAGVKGVRNVSISPGGVQKYVFPLEGNEKTIGQNLLSNKTPGLAESIERSLSTGEVVLSGPYELTAGGLGFVGRLALFRGDVFWGVVSTAVEISPLLEAAGFENLPRTFDFAIRHRKGGVFFGKSTVFEDDPIIRTIEVPGLSWEIGVHPVKGWRSVVRPSLLPVKAAGVLLVVLISGIIYLVGNRQLSLSRAVKARTEELGASEELFKTVVEASPLPIISLELDGVVTSWNHAAERIFGWNENEVRGKVLPTFPSERVGEFEETKHRILAGETLSGRKLVWQRNDGSKTDISLSVAPFRTREGKINGLVAIVEDITERLLAEEALRVTHLSVDYAADPFYWIGSQAQILYANKAACLSLGYSKEELLSMSVPDIDPFFDWEKWPHYFEQWKMGRNLVFESCHRRKDGKIFPIEVNITNLAVHGMDFNFVYVKDITERKRIENELRASEERFRLLVENAPDAILVQTAGRFAYVNSAAMKLFGASSEDQLLGRSVMDSLHPSYHEEVRNRIHCTNFEKKFVPSSEQKFITLDGSVVDVEALSVPITYENQDGALVFVRDIRERKRMEEERERLEANIRRNQKLEAIGTLAGGIAHDFNNILAAIIGYSEISTLNLSHNNLLHIRNNLDQILRASLRAKDLVRQILVLSRQGNAHEKSIIDTKPVIREAVNLLRASLPSTIKIVLNIKSERSYALADPSQIHQVLMNLCTNAAHAMEEKGGLLRITLDKVKLDPHRVNGFPELEPGPYIRLSVSDTGCGMDSKVLDRIFDPYFTTKEIGKGTGLGLAVVHGIIERHKGAITVKSVHGSGSTFEVFLPCSEVEQMEDRNRDEPIPTGTEHILLVDDEESLVNVGKMMLETLGYRVIATNNSAEALKIFQRQPNLFDLVVTDYTMPGITGVDLAKEIIQVRPDIPVIMCTGYSEQISEEKAKALGIRGFLMKPLSRQDLAEKVREAFQN